MHALALLASASVAWIATRLAKQQPMVTRSESVEQAGLSCRHQNAEASNRALGKSGSFSYETLTLDLVEAKT